MQGLVFKSAKDGGPWEPEHPVEIICGGPSIAGIGPLDGLIGRIEREWLLHQDPGGPVV